MSRNKKHTGRVPEAPPTAAGCPNPIVPETLTVTVSSPPQPIVVRVWCAREAFAREATVMLAQGYRFVTAFRDDVPQDGGMARGYATFWERG